MILIDTRPDWYSDVPSERQGLWTAGDHWSYVRRETGPLERIRVVLRDGTILDGVEAGERGFWNRSKHAIALTVPGRKTRKWVPVASIGAIWADKGPGLGELLTEYIVQGRP